jgi:hypothetical protein
VIETFPGACLGQAHVTKTPLSKSLDFDAVAMVEVPFPNLHQRSSLSGNPIPAIVTISPPLSGHDDGEIPVTVASFWYVNSTLPLEIVTRSWTKANAMDFETSEGGLMQRSKVDDGAYASDDNVPNSQLRFLPTGNFDPTIDI